MFIKLNKPFNDITYSKGDEAVSYGGIISYSHINDIGSNVYDVLPKRYQPYFSLSVMEILDAVPAHTDSNAKTVINFYVKSGSYKTVFFDGKSESYQVANQTNGKVFNRDSLIEDCSLVAHDGDAFCLNVERIHAVDFLDGKPETRVAVCLSTGDFDFDQVCEMLYETRCIN
jgi:hypothetical protein